MDEAGLHACTRAHFNLLPALTDTSASALRTGAGPQLFHAYRIATGCGTSGQKTRITPSPSPAVSPVVSPVVPLAALPAVPGSLKRPVFPPCTAQSGTIRAAASWKTPSAPASSPQSMVHMVVTLGISRLAAHCASRMTGQSRGSACASAVARSIHCGSWMMMNGGSAQCAAYLGRAAHTADTASPTADGNDIIVVFQGMSAGEPWGSAAIR